MGFGQELGLGFAKAHRTARAALHLAHEEYPDAKDDDHRQPGNQNAEKRCRTIRQRAGGNDDILAFQTADEIGIARRIGGKGRAIIEIGANNSVTLDFNPFDLARIHIGKKLRIFDLSRYRALRRVLEKREQGHEQQGDDRPEREITVIRVHSGFQSGCGASRFEYKIGAFGGLAKANQGRCGKSHHHGSQQG